jgi:CRP-like cAMP-binding protein/CheY-like chemotaxis protein
MNTVLLIERNPENREFTNEILTIANYKVLTAENGRTGIEIAVKEKPSLIIADLELPGLDGIGLLHLLQKHSWFDKTVFIFLSDVFCKESVRRALDHGADDILFKPIEGNDLLNAIEIHLKKKQNHEQTAEQLNATIYIDKNEKEILEEFINNRDVIRLNKRQSLIKDGERPTKLYYILEGKLRSFKLHPDGKELAIDLFGEGDFIGYSEIIKKSNYSKNVETIEPTKVAVIPRPDFEQLLLLHQIAQNRFIQLMLSKSSELELRLVWIAYNSLRQKVAAALLFLKRKYAKPNQDSFCINLNRSVFASIAGTAKESSIRILSEFKEENLIDIQDDGSIRILADKKLSELIE